MDNNLFRKKSIDRVSSPEQLNDRIRVTSFSVWLLLTGIILILVGIFVWGIFGRLNTSLSVSAITEQGRTVCYVKEENINQINVGMTVTSESGTTSIASIASQPVQVGDEFPEYLRHVGNLSQGEWVYEVMLKEPIEGNGNIFQVNIVTESIAPGRFVVN